MKLSPSLQLIGGALLVLLVPGAQSDDCLSVALSAIPACAQPCFLNGAPTIGCDGLDFACQCTKQAALMAAIEGCVAEKCTESDYQGVIDGGNEVCACAAPAFGSGGLVTVSGTVVGTVVGTVIGTVIPPSPTASSIPYNTVVSPSFTTSTTVATPAGGGEGKGGGGSPTQSPSYFATAVSISGSDRQVGLGLGLVLSAAGAVLAFVVL